MDPIGGISPNPGQVPGTDPVQQPQQPQQFGAPQAPVQPTGAAPQPAEQGFASVPMTDPNAPGPMTMPPSAPSTDPMANMMDPQPATPVASGGSGKSKMIVMVLIGLVLVLGAAAAGYFIGYSAGKSAGKQAADAEYQQQLAAQQQEEASAADSTPEDLDLGDLKDPETYTDESLDGSLGEVVRGSDGFVMRVNNIERNFTADDPSFTADPAKELIKVNFQVGNSKKTQKMDFTADRFSLLDSTGASIVPANIADYENKLGTTTLDPGTQADVSLVFEVTKDDTPLQLVRSQQYRVSNQDKVVTYKMTITVTE